VTARKEPPVAIAEARGDIGPAVARRNDQAVAAAAPAGDKDDSALTFLTLLGTFSISPPGGRPDTAAAQPATPTDPKAADGPVDKPKRAELPDSPATQDAAATDSSPRLTLGLSENTRTRNDALFYRERGVISYKRGALQQAVSDLDEAVRLDRGDAQAYNLRSDVLDEMGAFERALPTTTMRSVSTRTTAPSFMTGPSCGTAKATSTRRWRTWTRRSDRILQTPSSTATAA
jgi:tetratricopeptide (TPR) repeat protein